MFYHALTGNGEPTPTEDLSPVLLWENSNVSAGFNAQTLSIDLTNYAGVIIEFTTSTTTNPIVATRVYCKKNDNTINDEFGAGHVDGNNNARARSCSITDNGITFGIGYTKDSSGAGYMIPIKIYGVKDYVVEVDYGKHYVEWTAANSPYVLETDKPVQMIYFKSNSTASQYLAAYLNDDGTYSSYSTGFVFTKISDTKIKIGYSSSSENFASGTFQVYYII